MYAQVAFQGAEVVNVQNVEMAMYYSYVHRH
jgi:hypothetical protein